jgi:hypothetical protein
MKVVRIELMRGLGEKAEACLYEGQLEAAKCWSLCVEMHKAARNTKQSWPGLNELHAATKGQIPAPQSVGSADHPGVSWLRDDHKEAQGAGVPEGKVPAQKKALLPDHVARPGRGCLREEDRPPDGPRPEIHRLAQAVCHA